MLAQLKLGEITVDVIRKDIKNLHLSVYPPTGRVRISAPSRMNLDTIRVYAVSKLGWIKKQQTKLRNQERETQRDYITRESHYFMGKRYLLKISETDLAQTVVLRHREIELVIRKGADLEQRQKLLEDWYRKQLRHKAGSYISFWEKQMNLKVAEFGIKKMRTKWGSCNREAKRIWLNLELAKKPKECLEYIVVHEMVHIVERNHGTRFISFMDQFLPQWRQYKEELNRLPIGHTNWRY
ncbi:MAG: SprT family zinc-dependent metalloprotease [Pyrinomonadaceae bacterium]